jgi:hypothetical protein
MANLMHVNYACAKMQRCGLPGVSIRPHLIKSAGSFERSNGEYEVVDVRNQARPSVCRKRKLPAD